MDDIEATLMAFFNDSSSSQWEQENCSPSPQVMPSSSEDPSRDLSSYQHHPFQNPSGVNGAPSIEMSREQPDSFLNDFLQDGKHAKCRMVD